MNRTIKTIAGAAVLMSAVSLVPAFSTSAITLSEVDPIVDDIKYNNADETLRELELDDGTLLFASSASEDNGANGIVLLDNAASLKVTVKNEKVVFEVTGNATIQDDYVIDAINYNGATRKAEVIFGGTTTVANGKTVTVAEGSSLSLNGLANSTATEIVNNGEVKFIANSSITSANVNLTNGVNGKVSANYSLTVAKLVNDGTIKLAKNLTVKKSIINNGEIIADGKNVTINGTAEGDIFGNIVVNGADLTFADDILDLSSANITIVGEIAVKDEDDANPGYYDSFTSDARVFFDSTIVAADKLPTFVINVTEGDTKVTSHAAKDEGDTEYNIELNKAVAGQVTLKATAINYNATATIDSDSVPLTATNTITKVSTKAATEITAHIKGGNEHNYLEGWNILDESMNPVGYEVEPVIKDGYTYIPVFSTRRVVTVTVLTPDAENEGEYTTVSSSEKIDNDFATYGEYINSLKENNPEIFESYDVEKLELSLGGSSVLAISEDTAIENGQTLIITLVAKSEEPTPDPEEPEVKTIDLTVTAGDNTMTVEGYELSEGVNTYGDLADLFKNNEEITSLGTIETVTVLVDGEEANLEDEIVAGATVTIVITFESNDQPEITGPSLEVSGSVDLKDADKALETIKSSLDKDENILTRWGVESAIAAGEQVDFVVESTKIEDVDAETAAAVAKKAGDRKILGYYDIEVVAKAGDREIGKLSTLDSTIALRIKLSEEDRKVAEGYERTYVVVRVHGADVTILEATLDEEGYLNFESSLFSTYAVAYTDVKKASVRPVTPNPDKKPVIEVPEGTTPNDAGFIASEKSATSASIFAGLAAIVTAAGIAIAKLFKKSER